METGHTEENGVPNGSLVKVISVSGKSDDCTGKAENRDVEGAQMTFKKPPPSSDGSVGKALVASTNCLMWVAWKI